MQEKLDVHIVFKYIYAELIKIASHIPKTKKGAFVNVLVQT